MKLSTRQLTHAALLTAISIALTRVIGVVQPTPYIRLTFGNIPIYMAGLLFGPMLGGLVGAVADLVGFAINPFGAAFIPHIFLAAVMRGVIPPLAVRLPGSHHRGWYFQVVTAIIATETVSGILLTTWGLSWFYSTPFLAYLPLRLVALAVQVPVYAVFTYAATIKLRYYVAAFQPDK